MKLVKVRVNLLCLRGKLSKMVQGVLEMGVRIISPIFPSLT